MDKIIKLFTYVDGINDKPFPNVNEQVEVSSFEYNANRMGSAPRITARAKHSLCLDNLWSDKVYARFNGERYFIMNTPSSSKSNSDARYEHEIELMSEREILNHVYFIDAVQGNAATDRNKSNSTKVQFMGDLNEFVGRLNSSLSYNKIDYRAVIDKGMVSENKLMSFEDKYILEALQEAFTLYQVPYYFEGKTIHFGYTQGVIPTPMRYGTNDALLNISRNNANYKIINRITGLGSSKNIPYYYPNPTDNRAAIEAEGGTWITPSPNLMPPIYRKSKGSERFYNAINNLYPVPNGEGYYEFESEYSKNNQREGKVDFPDIEPTIKGITNASGQRIDSFLGFAYDRDDNDEIDEETNEYKHPYFFAKLRKTDGEFGFNLFDHSNEKQAMQISMTSGVCGACVFEIGVGENTQKNIVQVDTQGNLLRNEQGNVVRSGQPQDKQNDTRTNEVWIALKKDINTYPTYAPMPNSVANLKPLVTDTFVILGISLPSAYVAAAEKRLEDAIIEHMYMNNEEKFTFSIRFSRIFFEENPEILAQLNENSRIVVEYNGEPYPLYVDDFSYKMESNSPLPDIEVNLTDSLTTSKNSLQTALEGVKKDILSSVDSGDFLAQGLTRFIRKDVPDYTKYLLRLLGGADFGEYSVGNKGGNIDKYGNGELENLFIRSLLTLSHLISPHFNAGMLGTGFVLKENQATGRSYLEVDELFVRVKAMFAELEIRKLSYAGGNWVFSPAGMKCSRVEDKGNYWRCYFVSENEEAAIKNEFRVDDLVRFQEFNIKVGTRHNVSNRFYWRACVSVGDDYIDLSKSDCDPLSDAPNAGDSMVTLGNKTDKERQNAIVISAYGEGSPSITQHCGIKTYSLLGTEKTRISPQKNVFTGEFHFETGESIKDYTDNAVSNIQIGGRNLVVQSLSITQDKNASGISKELSCFGSGLWVMSRPWLMKSAWKMTNIYPIGNDYNNKSILPTIPLKPNTSYVLSIGSVTVNDSENIDEYTVALYDYTRDKSLFHTNVKVSKDKQVVRFTTPIDLVPTNLNKLLLFTGIAGISENKSLTWHQVKLEEGDKSTTWTAAPEDMEEEVGKTNEKLDKAIADAIENKNFVDALAKSLEEVKNQVDGAIETWFYDPVPTLDNEPAVNWNTDDLKNKHLADMYYDANGKAYRFQLKNGVYSWQVISDTDIQKALEAAKKAQDTADGKRKVFVTTPKYEDSYDIGDLWVNATYGAYSNDLLRCKVAKPINQNFDIAHWDLASKYTDDTKANEAQKAANEAKRKALEAQQAADNAATEAQESIRLIGDIANDNKLTSSEKYQALKEWREIQSEKPKNDATAESYEISATAYDTAYTNLSNYITPIFSDMSTTSDIVGDTFRATFNAYYDARTDLLNNISIKAKALANAAQTKADKAEKDAAKAMEDAVKAQQAADSAKQDAKQAKDRLDGWANDGFISPTEKLSIKQEIKALNGEQEEIIVNATKYTVNSSAYKSAYDNYVAELDKYTKSTPENIEITPAFSEYQTIYYNERTKILNAIATASKKYVDDVANDIVTDMTTKFEAINGRITAEIKSTKEYTDSSVKGVSDSVTKIQNDVNGIKGDISTVEGNVTKAQNAANTAINNANTAKATADTAKTNAAKANEAIKDMSDDNKFTPSEKQQTQKEWDIIKSEKSKNDATANNYGVNKEAYDNAYNALSEYITPMLQDLTSTHNIDGGVFRNKFKAYYDARTDLLNEISATAKVLADEAKKVADQAVLDAGEAEKKALQAIDDAKNADKKAKEAKTEAIEAKGRLDEWASDKVISPVEKRAVKDEIARIDGDKEEIDVGFAKYEIKDDNAFNNAYQKYRGQLMSLAKDTPSSIAIPFDFEANQMAYYNAKTVALENISNSAKKYHEDYVNSKTLDSYNLSKEYTESKIEVVNKKITLGVTSTKEYTDKSLTDLKIGSGNLILDSEKIYAGISEKPSNNPSSFSEGIWLMDKPWKDSKTWAMINAGVSGRENNHVKLDPTIKLKSSSSYMLSMESAVVSDGSGTDKFNAVIYDFTSNKPMCHVTLSVQNTRQEVKMATSEDLNPNHDNQLLLYTGLAGKAQGRAMTWSKVKFEEGDKATTWTPAAEDTIKKAQKYTDTKIEIVDGKITSTVKEVTTLKERVSTAETSITQTSEAIKLKASKDDLDTLSGRVSKTESSIKVNSEAIEAQSTKINNIDNTISTAGWMTTAEGNKLYASKTSVNDLTGRMATAESSISQNAEAITSKVSSTDYTGKKVVSMINQSADTVVIEAKHINLNGAVTFNSFDKGTQDVINNKASLSDIPDVSGFVESSSLGSLAYKSMVNKALLDETIIVNGFIKTSLINADAIIANMATIGGFTIESSGFSSVSHVNGHISGAYYIQAGSKPSMYVYSDGGKYDVNIGGSKAINAQGDIEMRGKFSVINEISKANREITTSTILEQNVFIYQHYLDTAVKLPSDSDFQNARMNFQDGNSVVDKSAIVLKILRTSWDNNSNSATILYCDNPIIDNNGNKKREASSYANSLVLRKGDFVEIMYYNRQWYLIAEHR